MRRAGSLVRRRRRASLADDLESAAVDDEMRPLLRYVRKLTHESSRMTPEDAEAVFAVGWDDRALHDAVLVCALFNFMNRMVDGLGIVGTPELYGHVSQALANLGYAGLMKKLQQEPPPED